jgi:hypothetical protein
MKNLILSGILLFTGSSFASSICITRMSSSTSYDAKQTLNAYLNFSTSCDGGAVSSESKLTETFVSGANDWKVIVDSLQVESGYFMTYIGNGYHIVQHYVEGSSDIFLLEK